MKKIKKLKCFEIKHLKNIYKIMVLIAVVLSTIVFFECFNSSDKRSASSEGKLIDFNIGWVDSNNNSIKLNPFLSNKGFKSGKTYTYYHRPDKNIKEGDSIYFRALSTDVTLYIGDKKKIITPYHDGIFTLSSSGTTWYVYTLKKSDLNKKFKIEVNAFYNDTSCYIDDMYVGKEMTYLKKYISKQIFTFIISILTFFLGCIFILLNMYINFTQKLNKHNLSYIGQFACYLAIWTTSSTHVVNFIPACPQTVHFIACIILYLIPIPVLLFIKSNFKTDRNELINRNIAFDLILMIIALVMQLIGFKDLHETILLSHISILISLVDTIYVFVHVKRQNDKKENNNKPKAYIMINYIVFIVISICVSADLYLYYSSKSSNMGMFAKIAVLFVVLYLGIVAFQNLYDLDKQITHNNFVRQLAYTDGLTHLNNRTAYMEKINELEKNIDKHSSIGVVTFDVNFLKITNDTLGHNMGDDLIISAANIIKNSFSKFCSVYRIGGDEFVAIIDSSDAEKLYKEYSILFNANINNFNNFYNKPYKMSIAYGCAVYNAHKNVTLNEIIKMSDKNMYENKMKLKKLDK